MNFTMFRHSEMPRLIGLAEPDPDCVNALVREAAVYAAHNDYRLALACYGRALLLDDSRAAVWFNYAQVQRRLGLAGDAVKSFEFALDLDPRLYAAHYCLANLLAELGRPLAAIAHLQAVTALHPAYAPAWRNLGRLNFALGHLAQAESCLWRAADHSPTDPEIAALLADVLRERASRGQN